MTSGAWRVTPGIVLVAANMNTSIDARAHPVMDGMPQPGHESGGTPPAATRLAPVRLVVAVLNALNVQTPLACQQGRAHILTSAPAPGVGGERAHCQEVRR